MKSTPVGWLFGIATLAASALLFAVQPMIGKMLLPHFGGTPGVWNTCMVFFQAMLLAGYAYAHLTTSRLGFRGQAVVHGTLAAAALLVLPIVVPVDRLPSDFGALGPAPRLFGLLVAAAGAPFFLIAATAPLLQRWFTLSGDRRAHDPYFLYAASNTGNLLALAAYPLLIEPLSTLGWQNRAWAWGFAVSAVLTIVCAVVVWARSPRVEAPPVDPVEDSDRVGWATLLDWIVLAAIPSSWLLAVTTYATTDLASMPLLWTIPLGVYLATYILAFGASGTRWKRGTEAVFPWLAAILALVLSAGFVNAYWVPLHALTFFAGALLCHQRLAESRPPAGRLTLFYLAIALGGVLGSLFNAIVAPLLFDRMIEYPLAVFLTCLAAFREPGLWAAGFRRIARELIAPAAVFGLMLILIAGRNVSDSPVGVLALMLASGLGVLVVWKTRGRPLRFALTIGAVLLAGGVAPEPGGEVIHRSRNFFGTLRVLHDRRAEVYRLIHGSTLHGQQSLEASRRAEPSTYFTRSGPIGGLFESLDPALRRAGSRVAIVGLGTGTLACYAQPGQSWTFYEIDDAVVRIAEDPRYFSYLADARKRGATVEIVEGDARLRLGAAPDGGYRLIVLDAFSSDAVPVHLLSREAIALYRRKLAPGGVLAFNLSNRYLDLDPLMDRQARDAGLVCRIRYDVDVPPEEKQAGKLPSIWAVMADRDADLPGLVDDLRWQLPRHRPGSIAWTDDYSNLGSYLVLRSRWARDRVK
ncbi:MAG: fused MFS/spermidine synthase [Paludisphaera borealis]|uniref:fused MFS/spermidine synthase n=1 Tax=Paludisphaera borealis TaxID=1387353 RepID=UPI00283F53E5|nr:fused MFS/spermidine synthase [Paludisphaera borealis]MDR3618337.1 fused MFS/spermidine synthase [Paludisphaera borealis]